MTLLLNNEVVRSLLTMEGTMRALEEAYARLASGEAVCRPRIDIRIPTGDPGKLFRWGSMEGGVAGGYFAIRMKSDVLVEQETNGVRTQEKYCVRPGLFCGLILLIDVKNGEPVALLNDGYLQHMRVGADAGIGVKLMAREDARVVGMIGSGGMARSHMEALTLVRKIERVQVYSPTAAHREAFAREMEQKYGIEARALDGPREVYKGADILAGCTDSVDEVIRGEWLEEGTHVTCIGGRPDGKTLERIDRSLRLGTAPAPDGFSGPPLPDEYLSYSAAAGEAGDSPAATKKRGRGAIAADRCVTLAQLLQDPRKGRSSAEQITFSERGNIQGAQFFAVAGQVYDLAKAKGLGMELPTEWFLQDIRD